MSCFPVEMPDSHGIDVFKATLCNHDDGVICTEGIDLGGKVTITYALLEQEKRLYLVEERSVTAVKLLTPFLRHEE